VAHKADGARVGAWPRPLLLQLLHKMVAGWRKVTSLPIFVLLQGPPGSVQGQWCAGPASSPSPAPTARWRQVNDATWWPNSGVTRWLPSMPCCTEAPVALSPCCIEGLVHRLPAALSDCLMGVLFVLFGSGSGDLAAHRRGGSSGDDDGSTTGR
jgi:hypothetical protein